MFSKACEYAIRATLYVSIRSLDGTKLSIKEIAKEIDSPEPFTAKILQTLSREGIISSSKGPHGGFFLASNAEPIPLDAIVNAFDGNEILHTCALGLKECTDQFPCPIHNEIKAYKAKLKKVMNEKTVQELTKDLARGKSFLKNLKTSTY